MRSLRSLAWIPSSEDRDTGVRILTGPEHKANVGVRLANYEGLSATLWVNYFDETVFGGVPVSDYTLVNGQVSYGFSFGQTDGSVYVKALNMFDNDHREHPNGQSYGIIVMGGVSLVW